MTVDSHQRYADDLAAYLLGALSEEENGAFEAHLATCDECRREAERLQAAADALPRSVEPFAPPPSLKRALMEKVLAESGDRAPARASLAQRLGIAGGLGALRPRVAVGLACALLVLGGVVGFAINAASSSSRSTRTISASVDKARVPTASASLVIPRKGGAQLRVSGLPAPRAGRLYEVWVMRGSQVEPASLFSVSANGTGAAAVPGSLEGVRAVMVTSEKAPSGAPAPTGAPIITVKT